MIRLAFATALLAFPAASAGAPARLGSALGRLAEEGRFSGAVVIRGAQGVRFARGYGLADPFTGRRFTPETPVDSASLAKPVTAAAALILARDGKLNLDAPVRLYLPEYPHPTATVRHLLAHSAGLGGDESEQALAGKTNVQLLAGLVGREPQFPPGSAFSYCNFCFVALALLVERIRGKPLLTVARERVGLPRSVTIRPARLADWNSRAIGHRRRADGKFESMDSSDGELFYGSANLSISAAELAKWGSVWWGPRLATIRSLATSPARVAGKTSGLTWGNWYCAPDRRRCHYLGHHAGFHHMLFWDSDQRVSLAMVSNNTLDSMLQQRLQRALIAFMDGRDAEAERELEMPLADRPARPGTYRTPSGETLVLGKSDDRDFINRGGLRYRAFQIGSGIRYVPGIDVYLAAEETGGIRWLSLYEDFIALPVPGSLG